MTKTLPKQVFTLRRALLVVALLCSLFACLGGDYANVNRLKQTTRTELCSTHRQEAIQRSKPERTCLKSYGSTCQLSLQKSLLAYNKLINAEIASACRRKIPLVQAAKFVQRKTTPADASDCSLVALS